MFKKFIKEVNGMELELREISNKIDLENFDEKNKYLCAKFYILYGKYSTKFEKVFNEYEEFLKDSTRWTIKSGVLIILSVLAVILNINSIFSCLAIMCSGMFFLYTQVSDVIKTRDYNKIMEYNNKNFVEIFNATMEKYEKTLELEKINSEKNKTKSNSMSDESKTYDIALSIILQLLYCETPETIEVSEEVKDMVIKILKYDLNTEENDVNKLIEMAREKNNKDNYRLTLKG